MNKHHEHEISEHPEVQWALDLLKPDPNYDPGFLSTYASEISCISLAGISVGYGNFLLNRPFSAGLYRHLIAMTIGYFVAQGINKYVDNYKAERDTRLRGYIIAHPKLFPEPERVKFAQVLEPWLPIR